MADHTDAIAATAKPKRNPTPPEKARAYARKQNARAERKLYKKEWQRAYFSDPEHRRAKTLYEAERLARKRAASAVQCA